VHLLLDTHVLLALVEQGDHPLPNSMQGVIDDPQNRLFAGVTSIWEVAIKAGLGRLKLAENLLTFAEALEQHGCTVLHLTPEHVLAQPEPAPPTRDPFDRVLLSICTVERMRLLTWDDKLRDHPLAWRPGSA
jgi:PIN domain nuclease of toxin-antitoxin system